MQLEEQWLEEQQLEGWSKAGSDLGRIWRARGADTVSGAISSHEGLVNTFQSWVRGLARHLSICLALNIASEVHGGPW